MSLASKQAPSPNVPDSVVSGTVNASPVHSFRWVNSGHLPNSESIKQEILGVSQFDVRFLLFQRNE